MSICFYLADAIGSYVTVPICGDANRTVSSTRLTFSDGESKYSWCNVPDTGIQRCPLCTERKLCPRWFYHWRRNLYNLAINYTMRRYKFESWRHLHRKLVMKSPGFASLNPFPPFSSTNCDFRTLRRHTVSLLELPLMSRSTSSFFGLTGKLLFLTFVGHGVRLLPCAFHWAKVSIDSNLQNFVKWEAWWNSTISVRRWWIAVLSGRRFTLYESWMRKTAKFLFMYSSTDHSYSLLLCAPYIWSARHLFH